MLRRLACKLDIPKHAGQHITGAALHGVMMERIDPEYAEKLHAQGLRPYSQHIETRQDGIDWIIQTLHEEAGRHIIDVFASVDCAGFYLKKLGLEVGISCKTLEATKLDKLVKKYYLGQSGRLFRLNFVTPTAFKSGGEYVFIPDLRLLFGSLMRKYAAVHEAGAEINTETLDGLAKHIKITSYNIKSIYIEIEGVKLPAFCGWISLKATGPQSLVNYAHFLLRFGEYSGAGIKCAMGMGAFRLSDRGERTTPGRYGE